jgi:hypothetical protein
MVEFINDALTTWDNLRLRAPFLPVVFTVWISSPLVAYAVVQCVKLYRREFRQRKLRRVELRLLGGLVAGAWGFRAAVVWHDMGFDSAAMHGLLVGFCTPYLVAVYFWWLNRRAPELAERLTIPRRRSGDTDPDDTGEFRM